MLRKPMKTLFFSYFNPEQLTPATLAHSIRELGEDMLERGEGVDSMRIFAPECRIALKDENNMKIGEVYRMDSTSVPAAEKLRLTLDFDPDTIGRADYQMDNLEFADRICQNVAAYLDDHMNTCFELPVDTNERLRPLGVAIFIESPTYGIGGLVQGDDTDISYEDGPSF